MKRTEFKIFNSDSLEFVSSVFANPDEVSRIGVKQPAKARIIKWCIVAILAVLTLAIIRHHHNTSIARYQADIADLTSQLDFIEHETELISMTGYYYMIGKNSEPLSDSLAMTILESSGAWYPDVIIAQMHLESNNFKSDVGKNATNGFGMKKIAESGRHRPTTQIPNHNYHGYGMYINWQLSLIDRILWEQWTFSGAKPSRSKYLQKIGDIYAEDPNYISKINKLCSK